MHLLVYLLSVDEVWHFGGSFVNIYCICNHCLSTIGFSMARGYFKMIKISPSNIMRAGDFRILESLKKYHCGSFCTERTLSWVIFSLINEVFYWICVLHPNKKIIAYVGLTHYMLHCQQIFVCPKSLNFDSRNWLYLP